MITLTDTEKLDNEITAVYGPGNKWKVGENISEPVWREVGPIEDHITFTLAGMFSYD